MANILWTLVSAISGTQKLDATGHVGRHPRILEGLRSTNTTLFLRVLKQALDTIEAHSNNCVIYSGAEAIGTGVQLALPY